jgi:hypothetical protein
MFVMSDNPEFTTEAKGKMPGDEGEEFSFRPRFVALSETEQKAFDLNTTEGTVEFLRRTFVGVTGVLDANNNPVPFSEATRDWMIDRVHTRGALVRAYFGGVYEAAVGN